MEKIRTKKALPSKLSGLLELAVDDAQAVARRKKYVLDMGTWHEPTTSWDGYTGRVTKPGTCSVCMAGAVIANTMGVSPEMTTEPYDFPESTKRGLLAINDMRVGDFYEAYREVYSKEPSALPYKKQQALSEARDGVRDSFLRSGWDARADWRAYRKAIRILREAGL